MPLKRSMIISGLLICSAIAFAQEKLDTLEIPAPTATNVLEQLTGRMAGVEVISSPGAPGMTPTIHIRGLGVQPEIEPAYVVDGLRVKNLDHLAPGSIERMEILKDAAAMALYGPDAAAGAVVVTTRRAHKRGFHAGYHFQGAFQQLSDTPEKLTLADWNNFGLFQGYHGKDIPEPEGSFFQQHNLDLQYGGEKISSHADLSLLDNNGPYAGRADTHRRYAASWTVSYNPLPWMSWDAVGRWTETRILRPETGWLDSYLTASPRWYTPYPETTYLDRTDRTDWSALLKGEIRPLPGLYIRGQVGYSSRKEHLHQASWEIAEDRENDRVVTTIGDNDRTSLQWETSLGYDRRLGGHRIHVGLTYRKTKEKWSQLVLTGNTLLQTYGLTYGDNDHLWEQFLLPAYEKYLETGWDSPGGPDFGGLTRMSNSKVNLDRKESIFSAGYDWKGRYRLDLSYLRWWKEKWFSSEGNRIPSVTVGWTLSEEPLLRRLLPAWWKTWDLRASWAETNSFIPTENAMSGWTDPLRFGYTPGLIATDARHRDLASDLSFQPSPSTLVDLGVAWFIHDDGLHRYTTSYLISGSETTTVHAEQPLYRLRNQGLELSASLKGSTGAFRYLLATQWTRYRNQVTFEEGLQDYTAFSWYKDSPYSIADGYPLGQRMTESGKFAGSIFPTLTGGIQASLGWHRWQATVAGYGAWGNKILHEKNFDALDRYYLETGWSYIDRQYDSDRWLLDGSFFRISQIRLDYAFPQRHRTAVALYASLENPFLFTRYPGSDPELALTWERLGVESAVYPTVRRLVFGCTVNL